MVQSFASRISRKLDPNKSLIRKWHSIRTAHMKQSKLITTTIKELDHESPNLINPPAVPIIDEVKKEEGHNRLFSQMNNFRQELKYCDLIILIGDEIFPCHRVVLASASSYFDAMFTRWFGENNQKTITLDSVDAESFEILLEFLYRKELRICDENAFDLLTASRNFNIEDMENICVQYMIRNLPTEHIFEVCTYAHLAGKKELYEVTSKYIAENLATLQSKREAILALPFEVLRDIVEHESLKIAPDLLFDLIILWKDANYESNDQVTCLLKNVKLGGDCLAKIVLNDDRTPHLSVRVVDVEDSKYMINEYNYRDTERCWNTNTEYRKERYYEKNIVTQEGIFTLSCSGLTNDKLNDKVPINEFQVVNSNQQRQRLKAPPMAVSSYLLSVIRNTIYLCVAGMSKEIGDLNILPKTQSMEKSNSLFAYMYDLDEWFAIPKPKFEITNPCMTTMDNLLYLIGDSEYIEQDDDILRKGYAQCYDPRSPTWISLPKMSHFHHSDAMCPFNGKLYVLGGIEYRFLEVFDPVAGRWRELRAPTYDYSTLCFVNHRNTLWAMGNTNSHEIVAECYHANENIWTDMPKLKFPDTRGVRLVDAVVL